MLRDLEIMTIKENYMKESEIDPYLRQSIFEIPSKSFCPGDITGLVSLHLYLPDDIIPTGQDVAVTRHNLC